MALLRIGNFDFRFGPKRAANLTNYEDEEPYMPGGGRVDPDDGYEGGRYDDSRHWAAFVLLDALD